MTPSRYFSRLKPHASRGAARVSSLLNVSYMNKTPVPLLVAALLLTLTGCGPRDYDDCILQAMKGVNSDMAARSIAKSCQDKFPERRPQDSELPPEALLQLTGHGGMGYSSFSGNIYNGNTDWTVTQVTIILVPKGKEKDANTILDAKKYNEDITVSPLTSSHFLFLVDGERQEYSWNIVKARGHRAR